MMVADAGRAGLRQLTESELHRLIEEADHAYENRITPKVTAALLGEIEAPQEAQ